MGERAKLSDEVFITYSSWKLVLVFLLRSQLVISDNNSRMNDNRTNTHSCYTCIEPLVGYTDHTDSCRVFNTSSSLALSYIKECTHVDETYTGGYECRKLVISYRSVDTYLRRDCVPKGSCAWKDKAQSTNSMPVSDCVYTDDQEQKLECIYCCDTPLCNRTAFFHMTIPLMLGLLCLCWWRTDDCQ